VAISSRSSAIGRSASTPAATLGLDKGHGSLNPEVQEAIDVAGSHGFNRII
jgi:hypothetical protein